MPQKITPCLWFQGNAEEAAKFYVSVFGTRARIVQVTHYTPGAPLPEGSVLTVEFELDGQRFMALNGDVSFPFSEAVSLMVNCDTQEEIDYFWKALSEGGQEVQCGWLKDRFGFCWQVAPSQVPAMISDPDPAKRKRVMDAIMGMVKIDLGALRKAYEGR